MEQQNDKALQVIEETKKLEIVSAIQYSKAGEFLKILKSVKKEINDTFDPIIEKAHSAHKEAVAQRDEKLRPLKEAEKFLGDKMMAYNEEQERKAREEQEKLRKMAEAEAKALEKRAENAKTDSKKEELTQKAEEVRNIQPIVQAEIPKIDKMAIRENVRFEVYDIKIVERSFMKVDEVYAGKIFRAEKGRIAHPGFRIWVEKSIGGSR